MSKTLRGSFLTPLGVSSNLNFNNNSISSPSYVLTSYDRKCLKRLKKKGSLDMIPVFYEPIGKLRNGVKRREVHLKRWKAFLLEN